MMSIIATLFLIFIRMRILHSAGGWARVGPVHMGGAYTVDDLYTANTSVMKSLFVFF